jgi:transcription elongation factor Elf1
LSIKARLYYPLILGLTNFYARIELDEICILSNFTSFRDSDLTDENLKQWFNEYKDAGLAFPYKTTTQTWMQFDTPVAMRRSYPTAEDNTSPSPPEREYTEWLTSIHGDKWAEYDLSKYQRTLSEKRADAGKMGGRASGEARRSKTNGASAIEPVDVYVDVADAVVDEGDGDDEEDVDVSEQQLKLKAEAAMKDNSLNLSKSHQDETAKGNTSTEPSPPLPEGVSLQEVVDDLVNKWDKLMKFNPKENSSLRPKGWEKFWARDFLSLLGFYAVDTVYQMVAYTQSEEQKPYYIRPEVLLKRRESVLKEVKYRMEHNRKEWDAIWSSYLKMVGLQPARTSPLIIDEDDLSAFMMKKTCTNCGEPAVNCDCTFKCPFCDKTVVSVMDTQVHIGEEHAEKVEEQEPTVFFLDGDDEELA